jgi:hypothetical protein
MLNVVMLYRGVLGATTLSKTTVSIMVVSIMTFSIITFILITLSIMTLRITTLIKMTQNDTKHKVLICDTQHRFH